MSQAGSSVDRPSPPSTDPSALATPAPVHNRHDQSIIPSNSRPTIALTSTDGGTRVQYPLPVHTVPEPTTSRLPAPQIAPSSTTRPLSRNQVPTVPPVPQTVPVHPPEEPQLENRTATQGGLLAFFGFGPGPELRSRRELMSMFWNLGFNSAQIAAIIALLVYSSEHSSPQFPDVSEWRACNKPLGLWNSIWAVKVGFDCVIVLWSYRRVRASRVVNADEEARGAPEVDPLGIDRAPPRGTNGTSNGQSRTNAHNNPNLPHSKLYSRLSVVLSILAFVWFVTSNVLIYSSVDSCRLAAPHIWWLTFSILSLTYLMLLELILLGIVVFVIAPVFWALLRCLGMQTLQDHDHNIAANKSHVGKLSQAMVEKIPLVHFIPAPEGQESTPIPKPPLEHNYPPISPKPKPVKRLLFFWRKKKHRESDPPKNRTEPSGSGSEDSWEGNWEKGEYPFVRLEGNRAACAICLMDFNAPKRIGTNSGTPEVQRHEESGDAEEEPQPLRLMACGHVFHKSCLDPWLTGHSGRCPTCQRPVETEASAWA